MGIAPKPIDLVNYKVNMSTIDTTDASAAKNPFPPVMTELNSCAGTAQKKWEDNKGERDSVVAKWVAEGVRILSKQLVGNNAQKEQSEETKVHTTII